MAKKQLAVGGTLGAPERTSNLEQFVSVQFHYDRETQEKLLKLCRPCEAWLRQFYEGAVELVATPELAAVMHIEACGVRFIRTKVEPARETEQRDYLELMERHSSSLIELLTLYGNIDGTTADVRRFLRKAHQDRGTPNQAPAQEMAIYNTLLTLKAFSRYMLSREMEPQPYEEREQKAKRRTQYRRFILVADLLAVFARITGEEPTAYAGEDGRVSNAIAFITAAMPPIVKSAVGLGADVRRHDQKRDHGDQTILGGRASAGVGLCAPELGPPLRLGKTFLLVSPPHYFLLP